MLFEFFKAVIAGICASATIGPVAILIFQMTLCYGVKVGFRTAMGSAAADTLFAVISIFAVSAIQEFVSRNEALIMLAGGAVIVFVGVRMAMRNPLERIASSNREVSSVGGFFKAFGIAVANPGALALMLALIAVFGLGQGNWLSMLLDALGVAAGALAYWLLFTWVVNRVGDFIRPKTLRVITLLAGVAMGVFGAVLLAKGVYSMINI